jgi:hypothetical protein
MDAGLVTVLIISAAFIRPASAWEAAREPRYPGGGPLRWTAMKLRARGIARERVAARARSAATVGTTPR